MGRSKYKAGIRATIGLAAYLSPAFVAASEQAHFLDVDGHVYAEPASQPIASYERCIGDTKGELTCDRKKLRAQFPVSATKPVSLKEIADINKDVNRFIRPVIDLAQYGADDFWTNPLSSEKKIEIAPGVAVYPFRPEGDCEDYVLAKMEMLLEAGVDMYDLMPTVVRQPNGEGHLVLQVRHWVGGIESVYVLDNLTDRLEHLQTTNYTPVRYSFADTNQWYDLDISIHTPAVAATNTVPSQP